MKALTEQLQTLLASGCFIMADLFTITLIDNTIFRYTSLDVDLVWSGYPYSSSGLLIKRGSCSWKNDLSVDRMDLEIYPQDVAATFYQGKTFLSACRMGAFDGAVVRLDRAFLPVGTLTITGIVTLFIGRIGEITLDRTSAKMPVNSFLELLNVNMPRNIYEASCGRNLYDAGCGLIQATYTTAGTVDGTPPDLNTVPVTVRKASNYYDNGVLTFTSGALTGLSVTVQSYPITAVNLFSPLPVLPANGDGITLSAGCDKTMAMCSSSKFNNLSHFRGFPFIPVVEAAVL